MIEQFEVCATDWLDWHDSGGSNSTLGKAPAVEFEQAHSAESSNRMGTAENLRRFRRSMRGLGDRQPGPGRCWQQAPTMRDRLTEPVTLDTRPAPGRTARPAMTTRAHHA